MLYKAIGRLPKGRVARGSTIALTMRVAAIALGFLQTLMLARVLGPEGYGTLAIVVSVTAVAGAVAAYGLQSMAVREIAQLVVRNDLSTLKTFVLWCGFLVLPCSLLAGALAVGAGWAASGPSELAWGLVLVPMVAFLMLLRGMSQGFGAVFASMAPLDLIRPGTVTVVFAAALAVGLKPGVTGAILIVVVATTLALAAAVALLARSLRPALRASRAPVPASRWLRSAASFFSIGVLAALQAEFATILLGFLAGEREAGLFQPALRIAAFLQVARQAIEIPLAPKISGLWEMRDNVALQRTVRTAAAWAAVAALAGWTVLISKGEIILSVFGPEYTEAAPALYLISTAYLFSIACGPLTTLLNMTGHQDATAKTLALSLLASVPLGVLLIPAWGALGGAAALSSGIVLWSLLMMKEAGARLDLTTMPFIRR